MALLVLNSLEWWSKNEGNARTNWIAFEIFFSLSLSIMLLLPFSQFHVNIDITQMDLWVLYCWLLYQEGELERGWKNMYRASNGIKHVVNHNAQHEVCSYIVERRPIVGVLKRARSDKCGKIILKILKLFLKFKKYLKNF